VKLKNINGISDNTCKCGSWLKHWERYSREKVGECSAISCFDPATIGAHVKKTDNSDDYWYIVPLCAKHNAMTNQEIEVKDSVTIVMTNTKITCARKG
jgi:hypothetical protein